MVYTMRLDAINNRQNSYIKPRVRCCLRAARLAHPAPPLLTDAFDEAQYKWIKLSQHSVRVGETDVHVLGVCHHDPVNSFLIKTAMQDIQPLSANRINKDDFIVAIECSDIRLSVLTKAREASTAIRETISSLSSDPPPPLSLPGGEHGLSDKTLQQWHRDLNDALSSSFCLPTDPADINHHFIFGHPHYSEELSAIYHASLRSAPVIAIDLPVTHPLNEQASAFDFSGEAYEAIALDALDSDHGSSDPNNHGSLGSMFRSWALEAATASGSSASALQLHSSFILGVLSVSCLDPLMMDVYNKLDEELNPLAFDVVVNKRNEFMSKQIKDLALVPSGLSRLIKYGLRNSQVAKRPPPGKILAIVGRSHARGLIDLLGEK